MRDFGSKEKIRRFFLANIGRILTSDEIRDASGGASEWARRVRELREDEGWPIKTHNDTNSLKPGQYLLTEKPPTKPRPAFRRGISARLRAQVLDRNGFTCQMCGRGAGDKDEETGRTIRLHIGHIIDKSIGGKDELTNLRALCSSCNQGAKNLTTEKPSKIWLLQQIRRAGQDEQFAVYEWLRTKFNVE
ncbi:MAG: HNH endonuclease [Deltaproteobacteria bacterium]|nr:HNH endonuclease [Deltaproteobacteria bacterium]